jgi:hypothetical protein
MGIFEELKQFNWVNPTPEELDKMIDYVNCINEELTEEQEKELYDYLNELEDMKQQQTHEYDDFDYFDENKDRLYYGVE